MSQIIFNKTIIESNKEYKFIRRINGNKEWYYNEKLHREDGPAIEFDNGDKSWYKNGKLHRDNGPAIDNIVLRIWYKNGMIHKEDGPACISDNINQWYKNGKLHRINGPAIEYINLRVWYLIEPDKWYVNGRKYNLVDLDNYVDILTRFFKTVKYHYLMKRSSICKRIQINFGYDVSYLIVRYI